MILLDTNVVSEPLRPAPDERVIAWIDAQPLETLFLSAITVAELRAGVALLPAGRRRTGLHESLETRVLPLFAGRVLPFDLACTQAYAALMSKARAAGLAIASADGYIAAIAAANSLRWPREIRPVRSRGRRRDRPLAALKGRLAPSCGCSPRRSGQVAPRGDVTVIVNDGMGPRDWSPDPLDRTTAHGLVEPRSEAQTRRLKPAARGRFTTGFSSSGRRTARGRLPVPTNDRSPAS